MFSNDYSASQIILEHCFYLNNDNFFAVNPVYFRFFGISLSCSIFVRFIPLQIFHDIALNRNIWAALTDCTSSAVIWTLLGKQFPENWQNGGFTIH